MADKLTAKRSLEFIPQIDGLRFVAAAGVMIFHWVQDIKTIPLVKHIPFETGVNLFFVISGFLITSILLSRKEEINEGKLTIGRALKNFYVKRALRIFPIYYVLLVFLCIFSYDIIKSYLPYLFTYSVNWYMVAHNAYLDSQTHLWSLSVEEQFYLLWPLLIFCIRPKWILHFIIISIVIGISSRVYFTFYSNQWMGQNVSTTSCFDSLGLGALMAYLITMRKIQIKMTLFKGLLIASIVLYIVLFVSPGILSMNLKTMLLETVMSLIFFFVVAIAAKGGFKWGVRYFLESKLVLYLGKISYGLYLYHNYAPALFYPFAARHFQKLPRMYEQVIILFIITVIMATTSWYIIERPLLRLKRYF